MRTGLAVLSSIALLVTLAGPARAATVEDYDLPSLPQGQPTTLEHMTLTVITDGATTLTLPADLEGEVLSYIGRARDGSYLVSHTVYDPYMQVSEDVLKVTADGVTTISSLNLHGDDNNDSFFYRLNDYRHTFIQVDSNEYGYTTLAVKDQTGKALRKRVFDSDRHRVLDYRGARSVITGTPGFGTIVWNTTTGTSRRLTTKTSAFADLGRDVLAVRGTHQRWAWASVSRPGRIRWQAWFRPIAISPDGVRVAGYATDKNGTVSPRVQVRRTSSGALLRTFRNTGGAATRWSTTMAWEDPTTLVTQVAQSRPFNSALVRCKVWGTCTLASELAGDNWDHTDFVFQSMFDQPR